MRIGQGFNSFTQQICIDDAVVVNQSRAENILTNDGRTMRMVALINNEPSAWIKQDQVILDEKQIQEAKKAREILEIEARKKKEIEDKKDAEVKAAKDAKNTEVKAAKEAETTEVKQAARAKDTEKQSKAAEKDDGDDKDTSTSEAKPDEAAEEDPIGKDAAHKKPAEKPMKPSVTQTKAGGKQKNNSAKQEKIADPITEGKTTVDSVKMSTSDTGDTVIIDNVKQKATDTESKKLTKESDKSAKEENDKEKVAKKTKSERKEVPVNEKDRSTPKINDIIVKEDVKEAEIKPDEDKVVPSIDEASGEASAKEAKEETTTTSDEVEVEKKPTIEQKRAQLAQAEREAEIEERNHEANERAIDAASKYANPQFNLDEMVNAQNNKIFNEKRKGPGMSPDSKPQYFNILSNHGVSQTVVYRSFFVEKMSDIANDMGLSAALAIKGDSFNVGGRGSYISPEKFQESSKNYYISVKVINQSINFKDALEFQQLPNIKDEEFRDVFGDCFISGFLEGGELNALISMKILNKASESRLALEASFAASDSAGTWGVKGSGAFAMAKSNLELNTETTIAVSWLGGGNIKPPNEAWTIESLTRAATRFPDMVAASPQRTYAILTKYENLRSYQLLKPKSITRIDYENATLYSNDLMDTFMAFKALYSRLTKQIFAIQDGTLKFKKIDEKKRIELEKDEKKLEIIREKVAELRSVQEKKSLIGYFPQSLDGLDAARLSVRSQMNLIIKRVEEITKRPEFVLQKPDEEFLAPFALEALFPPLESAFKPRLGGPLTKEKLFDEDVARKALDRTSPYGSMDEAHKLCYISESDREEEGGLKLFREETDSIEKYLASRDDGVEESIRLTPLFGNVAEAKGDFFTSLDFIKPDFLIKSISFTTDLGIISAISCRYTNGLSWTRGASAIVSEEAKKGRNVKTLTIDTDERITSFIVTVGAQGTEKEATESILGLTVVTNKGNVLDQKCLTTRRVGYRRRLIHDKLYYNVRSITFESPLERGYLTGFWGRCSSVRKQQIPNRLGAIWTNQCPSTARNSPGKNGKIQNSALMKKKTLAASTDNLNEERVSDAANMKSEIEHLRNELTKANEDLVKAALNAEEAAKSATDTAKKALEHERTISANLLKSTEDKARAEAKTALANSASALKAATDAAKAEADRKKAEYDKKIEDAANAASAEGKLKDAEYEKMKQSYEEANKKAEEERTLKDNVDAIKRDLEKKFQRSRNALVTATRLAERHRIKTLAEIAMDIWQDNDNKWAKISEQHQNWNQRVSMKSIFYFSQY